MHNVLSCIYQIIWGGGGGRLSAASLRSQIEYSIINRFFLPFAPLLRRINDNLGSVCVTV